MQIDLIDISLDIEKLKEDIDAIMSDIDALGGVTKEHLTNLLIQGLKKRGYDKNYFLNIPQDMMYDTRATLPKWDYCHLVKEVKSNFDEKPIDEKTAIDYFFFHVKAPIMLETFRFVNTKARRNLYLFYIQQFIKSYSIQHGRDIDSILKLYRHIKENKPPKDDIYKTLEYNFCMQFFNFIFAFFDEDNIGDNYSGISITHIPKNTTRVNIVLCFLLQRYYELEARKEKIKTNENFLVELRKMYITSVEYIQFQKEYEPEIELVANGYYVNELYDYSQSFTFQIIVKAMFFGEKPKYSSEYGVEYIDSWEPLNQRKE